MDSHEDDVLGPMPAIMAEEMVSDEAQTQPLTWLDKAAEAAKQKELQRLSEVKRKLVVPLNDWILIRKVKAQDKITDTGVVLTEAQSRSSVGEVVAVPVDDRMWFEKLYKRRRVPLEVGQMVIYTAFPIELEDIEALTGDKTLQLVRYEETYGAVKDAG